MLKANLTIVGQQEIAKNIYEIVLEGSLVTQLETPGQFVHVKVTDSSIDPLLRRPISICDVNHDQERLTMLYRAEGKGTQLLAKRGIGEQVDILGPLGNGFPVEETNQNEVALLVGGGIGVPPLYFLSKQLKAKGVTVIHVLGFAGKDDVFYEEKFAELGETYIATVDGSRGIKGFVTDIIEERRLKFDTLYSCGPIPMLKALEERFATKKAYISLEQRMGCGIGACFACVCHEASDPEGTTYKKVCSDGPVFKVGEVVL